MDTYAGKMLASSSTMNDPVFRHTLLYIAEHNADGALGFIVNQIFDRPLNALAEFSSSPRFPLYRGGPVDGEHLFFMHARPDLVSGGKPIAEGIYLGGDFAAAIEHINNGSLTTTGIKIFIGYCGWDAGELEAEMAEGSWELTESKGSLIFAY